MRSTIRTIETRNNIYNIGYSQIAKTTYEQREEQREELLYMIKQKAIGIGLILVSLALSVITKDATSLVLTVPIGAGVTLTKDHVIS